MEILKREHRPSTIDHSHFIIFPAARISSSFFGVDSVQSTGHDESAYLVEVAIKLTIGRKERVVNFLPPLLYSSSLPVTSMTSISSLICVAEFA